MSGDNEAAKRTGRRINSICELFTDEPDPQRVSNPKNAKCKHCNQVFLHHHKVSSVQTHLKMCREFGQKIKAMQVHERPDWYQAKKQEGVLASTLTSTSTTDEKPSLTQKVMSAYAAPDLTAREQNKVQESIAMYFDSFQPR